MMAEFPAHLQVRDGTSEVAKRESTARLLTTMLDPSHAKVAPASLVNNTSDQLQDVTFNCRFTLPADLPNQDTKNGRGGFMWFPMFGTISLYRVGIVNKGVNKVLMPATWTSSSGAFGGLLDYAVTFVAETVLPHTNNIVDFSPQIPENFALGRVISGVISLTSSTQMLTATTANGQLFGCAFNDVRNVNLNNRGIAYDSGLMQTAAITTKDYLSCSMRDGMVAIVGPDVNPFFDPPNPHTVNRQKGILADLGTFALTGPTAAGVRTLYAFSNNSVVTGNTGAPIYPAAGPGIPSYAAGWPNQTPANAQASFTTPFWYSPWGATAQLQSPAGTPSPIAPIPIAQTTTNWGTIGELGGVSFHLTVPPTEVKTVFTTSSAVTPNVPAVLVNSNGILGYELHCTVQHAFGNLDADGNVDLSLSASQDVEVAFAPVQIASSTTNPIVITTPNTVMSSITTQLSGCCRTFSSSFTTENWATRGKYVGSSLAWYWQPRCAGAVGTNIINSLTVDGNASVQVEVCPDLITERGQLGPGRFIKYENLDAGQGIELLGQLCVQAVPTGNVKQLTPDATYETSGTLDTLTAMNSFFNENAATQLRRIWTLSQYQAEIKERNISSSSLQRILAGSGINARSHAAAAGLFSGIGSLISGAARQGLSTVARGVANSLLNHPKFLPPQNQLTAAQASGRFHGSRRGGRAAGEFGAIGEFGAGEDDDF